MTAENKPGGRSTIATVIATASVTLAVGVTAAALGGYLAPATDANPLKVAENKPKAAQALKSLSPETPSAAQPSAPSVVFVPIAPDAPAAPAVAVPAPRPSEVLFAAYESDDYDDEDSDHHHRRQRGWEHEEHDDD